MDLRLKFNEDVLNYDKMRPTYVKELFHDVIQFSNLNNSKKALEIGIGTGQATLPFLYTGCKVTAIELGESLANFSAEKFSEFANFNVINHDFESVALDHNHYDLVYSATAFHWIPQEIGYTKVYQLLRNGGVLALFWNRPFPARKGDLHTAMQKVYDKYRPLFKKPILAHRHSEENCLEMVNTIKRYGFIDVSFKLYHRTRTFDAKSYVSLLNTYSDHRALQEDKRILLEKEIIEAINHYGGHINLHDTIELFLARKP
ncbi:Methyltransferase domain-containing protein [Paenibacillus sophorae]|uniref:Methyltransferase domain-containing protein n=1 Tax=Paenibacillus sophorae TaxID=1333845 RepID=A0A1H8THQ9_9BACL|nr:class I SAM-dependent methyltransferase [Paenibacillus sophorae]QWU16216.1 methyltransferase domain-containing protein [Paenibacillus sophorae]SEO90462.1 Methyltransferase domain-containing protein [Paenibacillus sophorae]